MTLVWEILIGFSLISLVAGIENLSITCTIQWVMAGAPKDFPANCSATTNPNPLLSTGNTGLSTISITAPTTTS